MSDAIRPGNGQGDKVGMELERHSILELVYNHVTHQVSIAGEPMPISLAQMILGEAARLLDEQRRLALANQLQENARRQAEDAAIADQVRRSTH